MRNRLFAALIVCLAMVSCERAKQVVDKVKVSVLEKAQGITKESSPATEGCAVPMDSELMKLVDQTEEGIVFGRDLPFPKAVRVSIVEREPMALRLFHQSQIEKNITQISAVRHLTMNIHKTEGSLRFADYQEEYIDTTNVDEEAAPSVKVTHPLLSPVPPKDHTMVFHDGKWRAMERKGFAELALAQQLGPHIPDLLLEYALSPRAMWFGKRRIVPGKPMEISGELLSMLVAGKATGALTITLEELESVHGHPCGRFAIKGSYQRKGFPFPDGRLFDEDTSIQSGHIWMSVLHPLVLQYHYERIVTLAVAEGSGPYIRFQGNTTDVRSIRWQAEE